jgi:hypothetical protein
VENVVSPIIEECRKPIDVALDKASMSRDEIDTVILIGGPMHMPFVREKMKQFVAFENGRLVNPGIADQFDKISKEGFVVDPMICVAAGAALSAGQGISLVPPPYGYGTILAKDQEQPDGTTNRTLYYEPLLESDSWQSEGVGNYVFRGEEQAVSRTRFPLIEATISEVKDGMRTSHYRQVGRYLLDLPRGHPEFKVTLRREGSGINLILSHPATGGEWTYHKVHVMEGGPTKLPQEIVMGKGYKRSSSSGPIASDYQADAKEILQKQTIVESLANELLIEARTRLAIKQIEEEGRRLVMYQISKLEEAMNPVSMTAKPIAFRYVALTNQMRVLVHDMQITKPPLLDKAMAQEWLSKIGL